MRNPKVASRYAKALIDLSIERKELDAVKKDVEDVIKALKGSKELRVLLSSPVIKPLIKQDIIKAIFTGKVNEIMINFLNLLITHKREHFALEVLESFNKQYYIVKNIVIASVTTAIELDDTLRAEFTKMVKDATKEEVRIEEKINPDIIGGFIVRVGDYELDSSIAGRLKRLSREFEENPYASAY